MSGDLAVQCSKLIEWLLARRVIPEDYTKLLAAVQVRVAEAQKEQITDETSRKLILQHEEVHYLAAKKIYEAIQQSPEGQAKSLLGSHTHPGAAKWKAVMDAYRKRHLGWASAARFLIQNVSYELTALTKQASACERQVHDCAARQVELDRQEANAKARYRELLNDLGIEGFDVRSELRLRAKQDLCLLSEQVIDLLRRAGQDTASKYQVFAEHAAERPLPEVLPLFRALSTAELPSMEALEEQVPGFRELRLQKGQSLDVDANVHEVPAAKGLEVEAAGTDGIDWGITCEGGGESGESGGINWDFEVEKEVATIEPEGVSAGIDWGAVSFEGCEIAEVQGDDAAADEAILADAAARDLLAREVAKALAFLVERCGDLALGGAACEEYGPKVQQSLAEVEALRDLMSQLEGLLSARRTQRLVLLVSSKRYLERTAQRVEISKMQCGKPASRRAALEKVKADQMAEAGRSRAETQQLLTAIKEVKEDLEAELTAHFKSSVRILNTST